MSCVVPASPVLGKSAPSIGKDARPNRAAAHKVELSFIDSPFRFESHKNNQRGRTLWPNAGEKPSMVARLNHPLPFHGRRLGDVLKDLYSPAKHLGCIDPILW